jgi:putative membrane protein insertion efficiency factor
MQKPLLAGASCLLVGALWLNGPASALVAIHAYQRTVAPLLTVAGARCRFTPSCSHYAEAVIARDGARLGGWKAATRIVRCGPWTRMGTIDEP